MLVSSLFIYNSKGAIDEHAVEQLTLATYISELLSLDSMDEDSNTKEHWAQTAPKFMWLLRDFQLEHAGYANTVGSAQKYMEEILKYGNLDSQSSNFFKVQEMLYTQFYDRKCLTLSSARILTPDYTISDFS